MKTIKQYKGHLAETNALEYLKSHGLNLITENYACHCGEIDLIMRDKETLVFIEVRFRSKKNHGTNIETVTPSKQHRIIKTALHYLQAEDLYDRVDCRFDIVGADATGTLTWIKNAFWANR